MHCTKKCQELFSKVFSFFLERFYSQGWILVGMGIGLFFPFCKTPPPPVPLIEHKNCKSIPTQEGPEDLEILSTKKGDYLLISTHDRRNPDSIGSIQFLSLDKPSFNSGNFRTYPTTTPHLPPGFRPHGISLATSNGKTILYSISHPSLGTQNPGNKIPPHTIEVFEIQEVQNHIHLQHIQTLSHPLLSSPNDLYALEGEKLYISNDPGQSVTLSNLFTILLGLPDSKLVYYEKGNFYDLDEDIPFGNGIWIDAPNQTLYRASHTTQSVYVYHWEEVPNQKPKLKFQKKISFPGGPDNLFLNPYGMFTAIHKSNWKFLQHSKDPQKKSPSEVWEILNDHNTQLIFTDDGSLISAASTALRYQDWIFIGQVFDPFLLACRVRGLETKN